MYTLPNSRFFVNLCVVSITAQKSATAEEINHRNRWIQPGGLSQVRRKPSKGTSFNLWCVGSTLINFIYNVIFTMVS